MSWITSRVRTICGFGEDEEHFDETEYFKNCEFGLLQKKHAEWLVRLARTLNDQIIGGGIFQMVSMPLSSIWPVLGEGMIATPTGILTAEDFAQMAQVDDLRQLELAEKWFPWWSRSPSAKDYATTARSLMWVEMPWYSSGVRL